MQRDGIRHAATFNAWRQKGRAVRRGEKSLTVLRPRFARKEQQDGTDEPHLIGFSPLPVFALEQTDGPELPAPVIPRDIETPEGFKETVERLREVALRLPHVAGIELRERRAGDGDGIYGSFNRTTKQIVVLTGKAFTTVSAFHAAYARCHGVPADGGPSRIPAQRNRSLMAPSDRCRKNAFGLHSRDDIVIPLRSRRDCGYTDVQ